MPTPTPNQPNKTDILNLLELKSEKTLNALLIIANQFKELELITISQKIKNPLVKTAIIKYL